MVFKMKLFLKLNFYQTRFLKKTYFMKKQQKNYRLGQVTVEYLLLAVALYALFHAMAGITQNSPALKKFSEMPSQGLACAIEKGVWAKVANCSIERHPTHTANHYSSQGLP